MTDFHGEPTSILENKFLQLEYLANSARIVRFSPKGKSNLFADLGLNPVETPYGKFYFRGGHRLWHSPEAMPRTYIPDNEGASISKIPDGVRIEMPTEQWTCLTKAVEIQLNPDKPQVILRHEIRNDGPWAVEFSAWALTMFRQGGVAIFPQPVGNVDEAGLLANRHLSIWPYTHIDDPRLILRDDYILIHAEPALPPIKIGYFNPHGWMAYWLDGILFVKRYDVQANKKFPDHGCNSESYCNDHFIELETLSPLDMVFPGQTVLHTEIWEIYEGLETSIVSPSLLSLIKEKP